MSSAICNSAISTFEELLDRKLTQVERLQCEDLAYNIFQSALNKLIKHYLLKDEKRRFQVVHGRILGARIPNVHRQVRWHGFRFMAEQHKLIYRELCDFLGDGFGLNELNEVVGICQNATIEEVRVSVRIAMDRGVRSAAYVRTIIQSRRRVQKVQAQHEAARYTKAKAIDDVHGDVALADQSEISWNNRLKDAKANEESEAVQREAEKKARIHRHGEGS